LNLQRKAISIANGGFFSSDFRPGNALMTIKFLCPKGHQLSAPESMAGKKGKCPKCSSAFEVPTLEELAAANADSEPPGQEPVGAAVGGNSSVAEADAGVSESSGSAANASGSNLGGSWSGSSVGTGSGKGKSADVFVFLCPNGHKLNGPPTLKGKAGKCPHCGAKFRIPTDEELEAPEEEEVPMGELAEDEAGQGFNFNFGGDASAEEEVIDAAVEEPLAPPPPGAAALGYIIGRLWDRKDETNEIEIFLNEGEIMSPDRFSEILSSCDYGVFGTQESDGTFSVTVIPWSAVRRIGMRKIASLPDDAFR
jgi:hypothetical protein